VALTSVWLCIQSYKGHLFLFTLLWCAHQAAPSLLPGHVASGPLLVNNICFFLILIELPPFSPSLRALRRLRKLPPLCPQKFCSGVLPGVTLSPLYSLLHRAAFESEVCVRVTCFYFVRKHLKVLFFLTGTPCVSDGRTWSFALHLCLLLTSSFFLVEMSPRKA